MESMSSIALPTLLRSHSLRRRLRRTLFSQLIHSRSAVPLVTVVAVSAVHAVCGVNARLNYSQIASLTALRPTLLPFLRLITKTNHKYLAKSRFCCALSLFLSLVQITYANTIYDKRICVYF